jgi:predicted DsbA family dithiol-disulfide isomerase
VVAKLEKEYEVQVAWKPFYLRPDTPPEGMELPDYIKNGRLNGSEQRLSQMAAGYDMKFVSVERILNTRLAHEATEHARRLGKGNAFHKVVFRKVYGEGQDISTWPVLREAAEEVGLDGNDMQQAVEQGLYTQDVADQVQEAYQIGVSGVPTYVINERYALVGAQPYEVFKNALAKIFDKPS